MEIQKLFEVVNHDLIIFEQELDKIGVSLRHYPDRELMVLDYRQFDCLKNHPLVVESRGTIMNYDGDIICRPFQRFFNLGENGIDTFDFNNSIAFMKYDGSLVKIYYDPNVNKWEIGTRGTAFAECNNDRYPSFRHAILDAIGRTEEQFQNDCDGMDKTVTRLYEYCSPDNLIVTEYAESFLVALSYISNVNGSEVVAPKGIYELNKGWNVKQCESFTFKTQDDCLAAVNALTDLKEGFVCYNTLTNQRVKIKNALYLAAHRLRGNGLNINSICEIIALGEVGEYISVFKNDGPKFDDAIEMYSKMQIALMYNYFVNKNIIDQKGFAIAVKDLPLSGVMFKARKNNSDIIHEFNQISYTKRAEWLKEILQKD